MIARRIMLFTKLQQFSLAQFCQYKYPYNINREEYKSYLKKVQLAEKQADELKNKNPIPRRRRRIYDRPRHDLDLSNYKAWRIYDQEEMLNKFWAHGAPVVAKLKIQPKWLIHTFGMGIIPFNHYKSAHLEFHFEDNNFSKFLLYEYRNTTHFKENEVGYDYKNQGHLPIRKRKVFRLTPKQFWDSEKYFQFRLNCSTYAEHRKFKRWVYNTINEWKTRQSYDQFIDKKFGTMYNFNKKEDSEKFVPNKAAILTLTPKHFDLPKKNDKVKDPKIELPKKLGEQYRISGNKVQQPQEPKASVEQSSS